MKEYKVFLEVGQRGGCKTNRGWNETFKTLQFKITVYWCVNHMALCTESLRTEAQTPGTFHETSASPLKLPKLNFHVCVKSFQLDSPKLAETPEEIRLIFVWSHKQSLLQSAAQMPRTESASVWVNSPAQHFLCELFSSTHTWEAVSGAMHSKHYNKDSGKGRGGGLCAAHYTVHVHLWSFSSLFVFGHSVFRVGKDCLGHSPSTCDWDSCWSPGIPSGQQLSQSHVEWMWLRRGWLMRPVHSTSFHS